MTQEFASRKETKRRKREYELSIQNLNILACNYETICKHVAKGQNGN